MTDIDRRAALALAAAATLPAAAQAAEAAPPAVWDLHELFATPEAWNSEREAVIAALPGLAAYKGHLGESAATLRAALQANSDLNRRLGRLYTYASSRANENLQDAPNQERRQLAVALAAQVSEAGAWISPELLTLGESKIRAFLAGDAGLAKFRFQLLDVVRNQPHTLDAAGEGLLASAMQPLSGPQEIRSQLVLSDMPWPEIELAQGKVRIDSQGYARVRAVPDRAERKRVFDAFFGTFKSYESSLGAALSAQVQANLFNAKARRYPNALAAALAPTNIPEGVYRTLVAETRAGLPVLHRYFGLRSRLMKRSNSIDMRAGSTSVMPST